MSNIDTMLKNTSTNQDLFLDLNEKAAETISGGYEVFTIKNETKYNLIHRIDGKRFTMKPNSKWIYTAYLGGRIRFDSDMRKGYIQYKRYNLRNGGLYVFKDNKSTVGNPYDINLYRRA